MGRMKRYLLTEQVITSTSRERKKTEHQISENRILISKQFGELIETKLNLSLKERPLVNYVL